MSHKKLDIMEFLTWWRWEQWRRSCATRY